MANDVMIPMSEVTALAQAVHKSKLWTGMDSPEKILGLMLLCQAEGLHPMSAVRQYDLIQGKPAMKSEAQLAKFYQRGGRVQWLKRDNTECRAKFFHPKNCPEGVEVGWTIEDARKAGLTNKDVWKNYPRQMLSARVQSEGVQVADPGASLGISVSEEMIDITGDEMQRLAVISEELTGQQEEMNSLPEAPAMDEKQLRGLRADLNKALLACTTLEALREVCRQFQKTYTKAIWTAMTFRRQDETFGSLAEEHKMRIDNAIAFAGPEGTKKFVERIGRCSSQAELLHCYESSKDPRWEGEHEVTDALHEAALAMGLSGLQDLEAENGNDEAEAPQSATR